MANFSVNAVSADGVASLGAKPFGGCLNIDTVLPV